MRALILTMTSLALLGGCTLQPDYHRPTLAAPQAWSGSADPAPAIKPEWWTLLRDPAIDALVAAGLRDNPTLAEAAARVDQARAVLGIQDARKLPTIGIEGGITAARDRLMPTAAAMNQSSAAISLRLSWEIDLWGRVRAGALAAQSRLAARTADADAARLSLVGDIVDGTLVLRACLMTLELRERDIVSRENELRIGRARLASGAIAPLMVAAAESNLSSARTDRVLQEESCRRQVNALVALSGRDAAAITGLVSAIAALPAPPAFAPAVPATVLLENPGVFAAEREAAARWSDIGVARAERLPRVDLAALLTGQWLRLGRTETSYSSSSAGLNLAGPLFDGGSGAATVRGAEAGYREALARLEFVVRAVVRDVEDCLVARQSADMRIGPSQQALAAATFSLNANEARWRAGAIAQFELEESRRQFTLARQKAIGAEVDRARAWVALMRRTGPAAAHKSYVSDN